MNSKLANFKDAYLEVESGLNVVQACKRAKISRSIYYKYKKRTELLGIEKVRPHSSRPNNFRTYDVKLRKLIKQIAIENPQFSSGKISEFLLTKFKRKASRFGVKNHLVALKLYHKDERKNYLENLFKGDLSFANEDQIDFLGKSSSEISDVEILNKINGSFIQLKIFKLKDSDGNNRNIHLCVDAKSKLASVKIIEVSQVGNGPTLNDVINAGFLWQALESVLTMLPNCRIEALSVDLDGAVKGQFHGLFERRKHQLNYHQNFNDENCFLNEGGAARIFKAELEKHFLANPANMIAFVKSADDFTRKWNNRN